MTSESFDAVNNEMLSKFFSANPDMATAFGMHDPYDHHLPDGRFSKMRGNLELLERWYRRASSIARSEELSYDQEISLEVLRMSVELQRFSTEDYPLGRMFPDAIEWPGYVMFVMMKREYAPITERLNAISSRLGEMPRYLEQYRTRYRGTKPVRLWTQMAIESCRNFPKFLDGVLATSKDELPPRDLARLRKNVDCLQPAIEEHLDWLRNMLESSRLDFGMGRRKFEKLLRIRGFDKTPDEILNMAVKTLRQCKKRQQEIAKVLSPGRTSKADVLRLMQENAPKDFDEGLNAVRREITRAREFIDKHDIVDLDQGGGITVTETPSFLADTISTAAMDMPAPFEKDQRGTFFMTRTKNPDGVRTLMNHVAVVNTVLHEAYPGHYLQGALSNTRPWMHQFPLFLMNSDSMWSCYETQEGWAHYCEKMMFDHGYERTLEHEYEILNEVIWRIVRVIYDVGFANRTASVEAMIELHMKETGWPYDIARGDVTGFSRTPGYGISYFYGRQSVLELRRTLEKELGGGFNEKKFHNALASNGNLPFHLAKRVVRKWMGVDPA